MKLFPIHELLWCGNECEPYAQQFGMSCDFSDSVDMLTVSQKPHVCDTFGKLGRLLNEIAR